MRGAAGIVVGAQFMVETTAGTYSAGIERRDWKISAAALAGSKCTRRPLVELKFYKTMLTTHRVKHQIETAALDALTRHLHAQHRVFEQLLE